MRLAAVSVVLLTVSLSAFAADPFVGIWKLTKSTKTDAKLGNVLNFEAIPNGVHITSPGTSLAVDLIVDKSQQAPGGGSNTVNTGADARVVSRPNTRTIEVIYKRNGKDVATLKREVSPDGRVLTETFDGVSTKGETLHYVDVFGKQ